ncbi:hypothetical protein M404DRAFT_149465, partial [Pisolithus tinctorius Marx 270]
VAFIKLLRAASLDDPVAKLDDAALHRLRNPPCTQLEIDDDTIHFGLEVYFSLEHSAISAYESIRQSAACCFEGRAVSIPSHYNIKKLIAEYTGVKSIKHDMCPDSCVAFTGLYSALDKCPICKEDCYDAIKLRVSAGRCHVARQKFMMIPLGLQLQALWRDPQQAEESGYLQQETEWICEQIHNNGGIIDTYDDFCKGSDYLGAVQQGHIKPQDIVLMISLDGAQLYESKESDCWIYIWKHYVLPGGFIPGPHKPKNIDSFLFPGLHHLAALQNEGLTIRDARRDAVFVSNLFLIFATADGPSLVYFDGIVGHSGRNGCRLYCGLCGCRKGNHYYPALLLPNNYNVEGSNHADCSPYDLRDPDSKEYFHNLLRLTAAPNPTQYKKLCMETGITKLSILLGLDMSRMLGIPDCLTPNIMHLAALLSDLYLSLWCSMIECTPPDHISQWPWAIFKTSEAWETHGALVSSAVQHLPGSFNRKPRNPAEKISSGYKTWEFQVYIFYLAPALLYGVLGEPYWRNFCKLVHGFQLICQSKIPNSNLCDAHVLLTEWPLDFKELYCQRSPFRLHFIRPCVHQVSHLTQQTVKKGPPICYSQWVMERTIGNLGQEIQQPSNPYANLSREGVWRCQVNTLKAMVPSLCPEKPPFPSTTIKLEGGYVLLRKRDARPIFPRGLATSAISHYLGHEGSIKIHRWARLCLPNGQITWTAWRELLREPDQIHPAHFVKFVLDQTMHVGEVQYFTRLAVQNEDPNIASAWIWKNVAVITMFSSPDPNLLKLSYHTVQACQCQEEDVRVIDIKSITGVIGMVPHQFAGLGYRYFMVERPGLDIATFGVPYKGEGAQNDMDDDEDDHENNGVPAT